MAFAMQAACLATAANAQSDSDAEAADEVLVLGRGETRQVQTITAQQIQQLPAGTSPLKAIENMPGVNFQSADPYGSYEWSTRITVRGFNQNRMGFTLDGVPLGDMTYGNHNGLHISRAIPTELVERVTLSQGTGTLATASTSNLGGAIEFFSSAPSSNFAVDARRRSARDEAQRTYVNVDTGELGDGGTRLRIAAADGSTEKWKGEGDQDVRQYNLKLAQPVGEGELTFFYNYSDRVEIDYQDLSKDIVARRGNDWDNWYSGLVRGGRAADACNASGQNDAIACDDAYWNASGLRQDDLGYVALELPFGDSLAWTATAYVHRNEGQGLWGTPYTPTPGGAPLSIRTTEYDLARDGLVTALTWTGDNHEVNGGLWYETNNFVQARRFYGEPSRVGPTRSFEDFQSNPMQTQWEYDFDTETVVMHLQDTWSLGDDAATQLRLSLGQRREHGRHDRRRRQDGHDRSRRAVPAASRLELGAQRHLRIVRIGGRERARLREQRHVGPVQHERRRLRGDPRRRRAGAGDELRGRLAFPRDSLEGLVAVYHVDFENRLLGITQGPGIVGNPAVLANVGNVKTDGVETALNWRPMTNVNWFTSLAFNDSEYDDDYTVTNGAGVPTVVPVAGKQVTDTPEILLKSQIGYDNGRSSCAPT